MLVDCTVPLAAAISGSDSHRRGVAGLRRGAGAGDGSGGVTVVSALHTVSAPVLSGDAGLDEDVLICGNRRADKRRVAEVIELIEGLRAVDAGPLEAARIRSH